MGKITDHPLARPRREHHLADVRPLFSPGDRREAHEVSLFDQDTPGCGIPVRSDAEMTIRRSDARAAATLLLQAKQSRLMNHAQVDELVFLLTGHPSALPPRDGT